MPNSEQLSNSNSYQEPSTGLLDIYRQLLKEIWQDSDVKQLSPAALRAIAQIGIVVSDMIPGLEGISLTADLIKVTRQARNIAKTVIPSLPTRFPRVFQILDGLDQWDPTPHIMGIKSFFVTYIPEFILDPLTGTLAPMYLISVLADNAATRQLGKSLDKVQQLSQSKLVGIIKGTRMYDATGKLVESFTPPTLKPSLNEWLDLLGRGGKGIIREREKVDELTSNAASEARRVVWDELLENRIPQPIKDFAIKVGPPLSHIAQRGFRGLVSDAFRPEPKK